MSGNNPAGDPNAPERDPRVYFAAERTLLAWMRTGLALMGFGFVVAKFGLFLREFSSRLAQSASHSTGISLWLGTALVALGVIVNLSAVFNHIHEVKALRSGAWIAGRPSKSAIAVGLLLAASGVGLAVYLVLMRQ